MQTHPVHLLVSCPDSKGLVFAITGFLASHGINILDLDQHTDSEEAWFFARVAFDLAAGEGSLSELIDLWRPVAASHNLSWRLHDTAERRRMAILVGKRDHCCRELLWRWQDGQLDCDIPLVISNHPDVARHVERFDVPFHVLPVTGEPRREVGPVREQESAMRVLLEEHDVDLVVLARYMQILSAEFVASMPNRIINIHHSFLPAFAGSKPYHQARARGVKMIGATCHYVTEELDAGPIIEQAVVPVNHRDALDELIRKGADLERSALVTGVRLHLQDRILVHGRRTVVFR